MQRQNAQNTKPPYLFYSPKCSNCVQLIGLIKQYESMAEFIVPVNVHTTKNLPNELVKVPTIAYNNQMLVGTDAFKWVNFQANIQEGQKSNQQQNRNQPQQQPQQQQNRNQPQQQPQQQDTSGPVPMEFNTSGKNAVGFDVLQNTAQQLPSYNTSSFSFLNGDRNDNSDGLASADIIAATDMNQSQKPTDKGASAQFEQLQKIRNQGY